jgi:hypothetical protein
LAQLSALLAPLSVLLSAQLSVLLLVPLGVPRLAPLSALQSGRILVPA